MPNTPQIFVFDFDGNINIAITPTQTPTQNTDGKQSANAGNTLTNEQSSGSQSKPETSPESTSTSEIRPIIHKLNDASEKIAGDIQHEIRTLIPRCSVQADIFFYEGSLIVIGSVVLTFLLSTLSASVQKELELQFTQLIEFAIKRVLRRRIKEAGAEVTEPIELDVNQSSANVRDEPTNPPVNQRVVPQYFVPLLIANTLLLLIVLILQALSILRIIP
jgi:hypothetical protein